MIVPSRATNLPFLPYGRQSLDESDVEAVAQVLRGDFLTTGPVVKAFENEVAKVSGAKFAAACSSGTAALHLATLALGLGPGDVGIVPSITFLATANALRYVGADVVFADVDPHNGLMDAGHLQEALQRVPAPKKARVVLPVHLSGQGADLSVLSELARAKDLLIVEDACHAFGGRDQSDNPVGACRHTDIAIFSFHPVKTIAAGEGGAVVTNDSVLSERIHRLLNHGMSHDPSTWRNRDMAFDALGEALPWYYEMIEPGFNYRLSDIHSALALSQLAKLGLAVERRRHLVALYDQALADLAPAVRPVARSAGWNPAWHLYVALIDFQAVGIARADVMRRLRAAGIGTQVHYIPVHKQPYYRSLNQSLTLPGAEAYYSRCLSLPLFPAMEDSDVARVVEALVDALELSGSRWA